MRLNRSFRPALWYRAQHGTVHGLPKRCRRPISISTVWDMPIPSKVGLEENSLVGFTVFPLGKAFFGESMFHLKTDASKSLSQLVEKLKSWDFHFIDSQMTTEHMVRLGAKELPRRIFLKRLQSALRHPTRRGRWHIDT